MKCNRVLFECEKGNSDREEQTQPTCPPGYHMGTRWAHGYKVGSGWRWAIVRVSTWVPYGLSGHGVGVGRPSGPHMGYIWAKWAWALSGQPLWVPYGIYMG